jgi:hypothetical protein
MPQTSERRDVSPPVIGRLAYLVVAGLALINGGCLAIAAGAAGGAAAAGYYYYKGRIYRDYPATLPDTRAALRASLTELGFPVLGEEADAEVKTRTADDSTVRICLDPVTSRVPADGPMTRVSIRVGAFGDEAVSIRILNQVSMHLVPPTLLPAAPQPPPGPAQPASAVRPVTDAEPPLAAPEPVKMK